MEDDEITFGNTLPPERFRVIDGRYRLIERLGVGGMGEVFLAEHLHTGQEVAIKRMYHFIGEQGVERFQQEARTATRVDHPGVVDVIDAGRSDDGIWYLVMERLDGQPLDAWMDAHPEPGERLEKLYAVLEPLAAVHAAGVVHRDLKPDNVFVLEDGRIKVIDFGIARDLQAAGLTRTGSTMGTPHYMSPEQAMDPRTCGPASDVWAVGVMMYVAVTGRVPFEGETFPAVCMQAIQNPHPPVTGVHPALAGLIDRCLAKDPARRPADAAALRAAWDALPPEARLGAPLGVVGAQPTTRVRRVLGIAALTGVATLAAAAALAFWRPQPAPSVEAVVAVAETAPQPAPPALEPPAIEAVAPGLEPVAGAPSTAAVEAPRVEAAAAAPSPPPPARPKRAVTRTPKPASAARPEPAPRRPAPEVAPAAPDPPPPAPIAAAPAAAPAAPDAPEDLPAASPEPAPEPPESPPPAPAPPKAAPTPPPFATF